MWRRCSNRNFVLMLLASVWLVLLSSAAMYAYGMQVPRSERHEIHHAIMQMEQQWRASLLRQDAVAMGALLNRDYMGISANGALETRDGMLANLQAGTLRVTQLTLSDQKVRIFHQTAVVTSVAEVRGRDGDAMLDGRYRYTHVYVRDRAGRWTIASFEASKVSDTKSVFLEK